MGAALVSLSGCSGEPARDALTSRCLDALRYHAPLESLQVEEASLDPRQRSVQIRYASTPSPLGARIPGRILCRHAEGNRWTLERVSVDGRELSRSALTLVNASLLLQDLARNPERFASR